MRGTISLNGWQWAGQQKLTKGLFSDRYRNQEGWTAEQQFAGQDNHSIGLVVRDERGHIIGTVQNVQELP